MATIIPFRGIRFNLDKTGPLEEVITPPYDVISTEEQAAYYARNPFNIIRLELGHKTPEDSPNNNRYTRSAEFFQRWLDEGILKKDSKPALYLYEQEFLVKGETKVRTGFIAGVKLEEYSKGVVLPHEETLPKHKVDRLELMRATKANFSPMFGLYSDPNYTVDGLFALAKGNRPPDAQAVDNQGVLNRLWVIDEPIYVNQILEIMEPKKIFIADGHHRYETGLAFAKERASQGDNHCDFIMMTLVNLYDKGIVVFPTHRLVKNIDNLNVDTLLEKIQEDFSIERLPDSTEITAFLSHLEKKGEEGVAFGLYTQDKRYYLLQLNNKYKMKPGALNNCSDDLRNLDVTILHTLILEQHLGIGSQQRADESNLLYTRDESFAKNELDMGRYQLAFFMNPTKVEQVTKVAENGEKMPQKSTYFYPKVITGLVINDFTK